MSKIDDKIALAEQKLIEQRTKFENRKKKLDRLTKERARLGASVILDDQRDDKQIIQTDKQRGEIQAELEIYPGLISEMEAKIEALKKENQKGILRENLTRQKKAAEEVERLSDKLGFLLSKANNVNMELHKQRSKYLKLHELTGQDVITKPTTSGSHGSLRILAGVINAELEGHPRPSSRFPPPGPAI